MLSHKIHHLTISPHTMLPPIVNMANSYGYENKYLTQNLATQDIVAHLFSDVTEHLCTLIFLRDTAL